MFRDILINIFFLIVSTTAIASNAVELTNQTTIKSDYITVGDIFTNTGEHESFILAPAPTASKPLVLTKNDLYRIVRHFKLDWKAPDDFVSLTLKGPSNRLDDNSVLVPTLAIAVSANTLITQDMVIEVAVPRSQITPYTLLRAEDMIGMMTKRTVMANLPISQKDITPQTLVKRNELITVTYKNGTINLTTKARALENASAGEVITLMNITSKKPFQAVVSGLQQAEVIIGQNS